MGYDNLKLEKGMYRQGGKSFTQVLESLDPSENYRGTALEGSDAFQRQLKRFGIRAKGAGSSPVEKFFATSDSAVLFPEYIARTVRQGMDENDILPSIVATTTVIDAMDYRSIYSDMADADKELKDVAEGAAIPTTEIKTKEHLVSLSKQGRMLVASYEAIRFQKLDLFGVMLRQIGSYIQKQQLKDAVNVIMNGDGNSNPAAVYTVGASPITGTKGTLTYDQVVSFSAQRAVSDETPAMADAPWTFVMEELLIPGTSEPPDPTEPFTLTVVRSNVDEQFAGCRFTSQQRQDTIKGVTQIRKGTAERRNVMGIL